MKKRVLEVFGVIFFSFLLSGCFSIEPPKPYKEKINKNDLDRNAKKYILEQILAQQKLPRGVRRSHDCLKLNVRNNRIYSYYENCFSVRDDYIVRRDHSRRLRDNRYYVERQYDDFPIVKTYVKFINDLQKNLTKEYNKKIEEYKNSLFIYNEKKREALKKNMKIKLIDGTGLLPEKVKQDGMKKYPIYYSILSREKMIFQKKEDVNKFVYLYIGRLNPEESYAKYGSYLLHINLDKSFIRCSLDACTDSFKVYIDNLKYNFVPRKFVVENADLKVVAINKKAEFYLGKSYMESLQFTNKTTKFIKITTISMYYNNKVNNILLRQPISLSPMSTFILKRDSQLEYIEKMIRSNFFYKSSQGIIGYNYLPVRSKDMKVKYGLSIAYSLNNTEEKSLYKVEEMKYAK